MKLSRRQKIQLVCGILPLLLCVAAAVHYLAAGGTFSVEAVLNYTPERPVLAAATLVLLYAVKSLSVVFPLVVLEIAGGYLFPPLAALGVNCIGLAVCTTIPYCVGRVSGAALVGQLEERYPRLKEFMGRQRSSSLFLPFFLRIVGCLPGDVISLYFGATGTTYWRYLVGSLLGLLPDMAAVTVMGATITDPTSPAFLGAFGLTILFSASSALIYALYRRRKRKAEADNASG
ncbi:MAG: VTT domain-containing protein [Clostridiales bacterium]|nr:VTT domain-containing protein [Clostridiales bacterium]MCD8368670.1 VTT domain-containing protein [Clostridiales bacterium]